MLLVDAGFLVRKSHQHIISGCRMVLQKQGKNLQNGIVLAAFFDTVQCLPSRKHSFFNF